MERALDRVGVGGSVAVRGADPHLEVHLRAWARARGHGIEPTVGGVHLLVKGPASELRWWGAQRCGGPAPAAVLDEAKPSWGLAARGALIEDGGPDLVQADLCVKSGVWADVAPKLYAQALAGQWDPAAAIDWGATVDLPEDVEVAVVQVMTYLIENEQAALMVPARFVGRVHPHFREVVALLAVQLADEARHVEVFTRRALLRGSELGVSGAGGRASLQTLLDEPDFSTASFLLSVLGEGTFLHLLAFLERHAPDPVTAQVARLALQDEARHVAFGMAHLEQVVSSQPDVRDRLRRAVERRHDALQVTAGLHDGVHDALVVLAAGEWSPSAIARGWDRVQFLQAEMDEGRRRRLVRLGFGADEAVELSALHTRNFM
ncbi:MAG: ferritin-like domain-containing protein [Acidimicrobiales bacterium]